MEDYLHGRVCDKFGLDDNGVPLRPHQCLHGVDPSVEAPPVRTQKGEALRQTRRSSWGGGQQGRTPRAHDGLFRQHGRLHHDAGHDGGVEPAILRGKEEDCRHGRRHLH